MDYKWYIEGCFSKTGPAETATGFRDVNRFITLGTHPGTDNLTIPAYVEALVTGTGQTRTGSAPIQVSQQLHGHADKALAIPILLNRGGLVDWHTLSAEVRKDVEIASSDVK